jgi:glyoxylase-like metal-dependent hydrolase (beta-lactamase superfamily II)
LLLESGTPSRAFALPIAELRRLADTVPGAKPGAVRVERVAAFEFPSTAVVAGDGWAVTQMPVFSYQLLYADRAPLVIDAALDEATAKSESAHGFDAAAFARVQRGLEEAGQVVVTHEHFDHLGGLSTHPKLEALAPHVVLTKAQLAKPEKQSPLTFPADVARALSLLDFEGGHAVAPGVVLWRAPGHTPGSQLVFVQTASGAEYLFLGDVAWHRANVDRVRERARLVTAVFLGEDRDAVLAQLAALHALTQAEPGVHVVPGHDGPAVDELIRAGHLVQQFQVTPTP